MKTREDKLVELIQLQEEIKIETKADKYRWNKLQSAINKLEAWEIQSIQMKGGEKNV